MDILQQKTITFSDKDIESYRKAVRHLESFWVEYNLPQATWLEPIIEMAGTLDDQPHDMRF